MANHLLNPALLRTLVKPGAYPDGEGLYLRVRGPQQRAWAFRYMLRGKATWMGLGPYPDVGLAAAREKATAARQQAKSGTDPLADKRARQAAAMATEEREKAAAKADARTFRTAAEEYLRLNEGGWRNAKHAAQWPATLAAYVYPVIGDKPRSSAHQPAAEPGAHRSHRRCRRCRAWCPRARQHPPPRQSRRDMKTSGILRKATKKGPDLAPSVGGAHSAASNKTSVDFLAGFDNTFSHRAVSPSPCGITATCEISRPGNVRSPAARLFRQAGVSDRLLFRLRLSCEAQIGAAGTSDRVGFRLPTAGKC